MGLEFTVSTGGGGWGKISAFFDDFLVVNFCVAGKTGAKGGFVRMAAGG